jgi:hypothetical protein
MEGRTVLEATTQGEGELTHITLEDSAFYFSWRPAKEGDEFSVYLSFPETEAGDAGAVLIPTQGLIAFVDMIRPHYDRIKNLRSYEIVN